MPMSPSLGHKHSTVTAVWVTFSSRHLDSFARPERVSWDQVARPEGTRGPLRFSRRPPAPSVAAIDTVLPPFLN
jgi:hypothetical protein